MNKQNRKALYSARRLALCAMFCAAALVIFTIEAQIPNIVPVQGVKLGLANIITLFALIYLTPGETLMILVARILFGAVFAAQPMLIPYSLCGGVLCLLGEYVLIKLCERNSLRKSVLSVRFCTISGKPVLPPFPSRAFGFYVSADTYYFRGNNGFVLRSVRYVRQ